MAKVFINRLERFPSVDAIRKSRFIELIVLSWKTAAVGSLILKILKDFHWPNRMWVVKGGTLINSTISAFPSEGHDCWVGMSTSFGLCL